MMRYFLQNNIHNLSFSFNGINQQQFHNLAIMQNVEEDFEEGNGIKLKKMSNFNLVTAENHQKTNKVENKQGDQPMNDYAKTSQLTVIKVHYDTEIKQIKEDIVKLEANIKKEGIYQRKKNIFRIIVLALIAILSAVGDGTQYADASLEEPLIIKQNLRKVTELDDPQPILKLLVQQEQLNQIKNEESHDNCSACFSAFCQKFTNLANSKLEKTRRLWWIRMITNIVGFLLVVDLFIDLIRADRRCCFKD